MIINKKFKKNLNSGENIKKPRKLIDFRENAGKLLIDLGKLVFGSIFLGGVLRGEVPPVIMIIGGFIISALFCFIGIWWTLKEKKNGDNNNSPALMR